MTSLSSDGLHSKTTKFASLFEKNSFLPYIYDWSCKTLPRRGRKKKIKIRYYNPELRHE